MIFLISETLFKSGINNWNNNFIDILIKHGIEYKYINIAKNKTLTEITESIVILNNVRDESVINTDVLSKISENNKLYYVIHGNVCPTNKVFVLYSKLFHGVITISKKVQSIIAKYYPNKHIIYLPNRIHKLKPVNNNNKKKNKNNIINFGYVGRISKEKNILR